MPTLRSRNKMPNPRKIEAKRLSSSSLKTTLSFGLFLSVDLFGRLTSNTKNQAVKKVPTVRRTVDRLQIGTWTGIRRGVQSYQ